LTFIIQKQKITLLSQLHNLKIMRSILNKLIIFVMAFSFVTAVALAANDYDPDKGTVAVNVSDSTGNAVSGTWYLHQYNISGAVPRNGSSSEVFQIAPGTYYLEARLAGTYKAFWLKSTDPQSVSAGQTMTFDLVYYATQEAKEQAQQFAEMQADEATALADEEAVAEPVAEPVEITAEEPIAETIEEAPAEESAPSTVTLPAQDELTTTSEVPTFNTAPTTDSVDEGYEIGAITGLAQTGPELAVLFIPSAVAGLWFATRRRK
jgi:hypothetical protein